jgi:hypothetical protein
MLFFERLEDKDPLLAFQVRCGQQKKKVEFLEAVFSKKELLIFDGIEWLLSYKTHKGQWMIFIEEDLEKVRGVLDHPIFLELVEDKQAAIVHCMKLPFFIGGKELDVFSNSHTKLFMEFVQEAISFESIYREGLDQGISHFRNVFESLLTLPKITLLSSLKGDFEKPWLIVGGAPLTSQEQLWIQEAKDTHWICAAGSGTKNLLDIGIEPDFATFVDPQTDLQNYRANKVPTFFQLRGKTEYLSRQEGPLIWSGENGLYPLEKELCLMAGLEVFVLEGGYDTFNFAVAIATFLKARSIESIGFSSGRDTINDLLSRIQLSKLDIKPYRPSPNKEKIAKNWSGKQIELDQKQVLAFCKKILSAEDEIDFERLGLLDGYLDRIRFFAGREDVDLSLLKKVVENAVAQQEKKVERFEGSVKSLVKCTT